jgi:hypothetical protein
VARVGAFGEREKTFRGRERAKVAADGLNGKNIVKWVPYERIVK